jgi:hypothetical protein
MSAIRQLSRTPQGSERDEVRYVFLSGWEGGVTDLGIMDATVGTLGRLPRGINQRVRYGSMPAIQSARVMCGTIAPTLELESRPPIDKRTFHHKILAAELNLSNSRAARIWPYPAWRA